MPSLRYSSFFSALFISALIWGSARQVRATEPARSPYGVNMTAFETLHRSASTSGDTAYFTNNTSSGVIGLQYTGVLAAVFFIFEGDITPTSQLPSEIILGWEYRFPYTNVLASPLGPGPNGMPSFGTGPIFTYTGTGKIVWAEASDTLGHIVPVEYPGGAYHGCGYQWSGNVDCDQDQNVDISDLTRLIDYLYISRSPLCCEGEANCDGSPGIDIGDLTRLIDFLYINQEPPAPCR